MQLYTATDDNRVFNQAQPMNTIQYRLTIVKSPLKHET